MPKNAEFVIAAYTIVTTVVLLYAFRVQIKLSMIKTKLKALSQGK